MATLPTVPSFTSNDSSMTKLQQLAACVTFLAQADQNITNSLPAWHYYQTTAQNLTASTLTQITFQNHPLDTDGTFTTGGAATIQTQGIYACQAEVTINDTATNQLFKVFFMITAGASNPNHTSGSKVSFGGGSIGTGTSSGDNSTQTAQGYSPWVCYPGDTIGVMAFADAAMSTATGGAYTQFSGRWAQLQSTP